MHLQFYRAYDRLLTKHMSKNGGIGHDLTLVRSDFLCRLALVRSDSGADLTLVRSDFLCRLALVRSNSGADLTPVRSGSNDADLLR